MFAVFSKDADLARILELEGKDSGLSFTADAEAAEVWLVDLDRTPTLPKAAADTLLVGFCAEPSRLSAARHKGLAALFPFPFARDELQRFLRSLTIGKGTDIPLSLEENCLLLGSDRIRLSPTERRLLATLLEHRGKTVSREVLLSLLGENQKSNALEVYMHRLRHKLEYDRITRLVAHRGVGYCLL